MFMETSVLQRNLQYSGRGEVNCRGKETISYLSMLGYHNSVKSCLVEKPGIWTYPLGNFFPTAINSVYCTTFQICMWQYTACQCFKKGVRLPQVSHSQRKPLPKSIMTRMCDISLWRQIYCVILQLFQRIFHAMFPMFSYFDNCCHIYNFIELMYVERKSGPAHLSLVASSLIKSWRETGSFTTRSMLRSAALPEIKEPLTLQTQVNAVITRSILLTQFQMNAIITRLLFTLYHFCTF